MTEVPPVLSFAALAVLVFAFWLVHREHAPRRKP
jgi:hypothetical protein